MKNYKSSQISKYPNCVDGKISASKLERHKQLRGEGSWERERDGLFISQLGSLSLTLQINVRQNSDSVTQQRSENHTYCWIWYVNWVYIARKGKEVLTQVTHFFSITPIACVPQTSVPVWLICSRFLLCGAITIHHQTSQMTISATFVTPQDQKY